MHSVFVFLFFVALFCEMINCLGHEFARRPHILYGNTLGDSDPGPRRKDGHERRPWLRKRYFKFKIGKCLRIDRKVLVLRFSGFLWLSSKVPFALPGAGRRDPQLPNREVSRKLFAIEIQ